MIRPDDEDDPERPWDRIVDLITWDRIFAVCTVASMVVLMAALGWWLSIDRYDPAWASNRTVPGSAEWSFQIELRRQGLTEQGLLELDQMFPRPE